MHRCPSKLTKSRQLIIRLKTSYRPNCNPRNKRSLNTRDVHAWQPLPGRIMTWSVGRNIIYVSEVGNNGALTWVTFCSMISMTTLTCYFLGSLVSPCFIVGVCGGGVSMVKGQWCVNESAFCG